MKPIHLIILGQPKAQPRHRHFTRGSLHGTYDPAKQAKHSFLSLAFENAPNKPLDIPLRVDINFYFQRPKNHYGTGKNANVLKTTAPYFHTSKPDADNLRKFCLDALNKVFWRDDSIICQGYSQKIYSENPRTKIFISEAKENPLP